MTYILLLQLLLCVHSYKTKPRKTLTGFVPVLGGLVRARVHRELAIVWLWTGAATAFAHGGCIRSPTHRSLLVHLCLPRAAAVPGSPQSISYVFT